MGPNWRATVTPTSATLPVSSNTSQSIAMRMAQPDVFEMSCETT